MEDGSAQAHVYISDSLVPVAMGVATSEWSTLVGMVEKVGQVFYNRQSFSKTLPEVSFHDGT